LTLPANCTNVALSFWNPFTGPDGPFMGKLVEGFNSKNPKIKVTMTTQAEYYTQLGTAAASGTLPDVAIVHADQMATQVFNNILRPMDDMVTKLGVSASDFPEAVWKAGDVAGKHYSIPLDIHPMTMFYNEAMLKAAGLTAPPKTADEFTKAAAAMTSGGKKGFDITSGFPVMQIFLQLLYQNGGTAFNADGTKATWNSDAGVKALQWMKDAQSKYSDPKLETDAELAAFKSGTVGIVWNGIWQTSSLTGTSVSFPGKATAIPTIGAKPATWAGSHQLTLPVTKGAADACKDAAAAMFIKYTSDNSVEWAKAGQIPAKNSVRNSAEFKALDPQASIAPSVENAFFQPSVPGINDALAPGPLENAVAAVMSGSQSDPKAALDDAAKRADQVLADNKAKFGDKPKS
jgi:multiple sugar transport system substrate-binding protein